MSGFTLFRQFGEVVLAIALAPLFSGWIAQCRAWLQNRSAPPLLQPYRMLRKLFNKDAAMADGCICTLSDGALRRVRNDGVRRRHHSFAGYRPALRARGRCHRADWPLRHGACLARPRRHGHRHRFRHARSAPGDDDRFSCGAGAFDGPLQCISALWKHVPVTIWWTHTLRAGR